MRVICAMALGATRDHRRGNDYVHALVGNGLGHPDVGAAVIALGGHKLDRPGKPPLYFGP